MTSGAERKSNQRHPIIVRVFGYLTIQAFVLMLLIPLPWPGVDIYSFVHVRESVIPTPVWVLYWAQVLIGLFLSLRGKAFLLGQFLLFAFAVLMFARTKQIPGRGDEAVVPSSIYISYWIQFLVTTVGVVSWRLLNASNRKKGSSEASEQSLQPDTEKPMKTDEPELPTRNAGASEAARIHDGRQLALLSLVVYLIGLFWFLKIAIFESGLSAAFNAIFVVMIGMVSSVCFAILASFTYPRALAMLIVHAVTVALLLFLQYLAR